MSKPAGPGTTEGVTTAGTAPVAAAPAKTTPTPAVPAAVAKPGGPAAAVAAPAAKAKKPAAPRKKKAKADSDESEASEDDGDTRAYKKRTFPTLAAPRPTRRTRAVVNYRALAGELSEEEEEEDEGEDTGYAKAYPPKSAAVADGDDSGNPYRSKAKPSALDVAQLVQDDDDGQIIPVAPPKKKKYRAPPPDEGPFNRYTQRFKGLLRRARLYQTTMDTLEAEFWTSSRKQSPAHAAAASHAEVQRAETLVGIEDVKVKMRATILELWDHHKDLTPVGTTEEGILVDDIVCSVCRNVENDDLPNNDTLLCDLEGCNLAFHQQCCLPLVTCTDTIGDDWFCPRCTCLTNAMGKINEVFETDFVKPDDVFKPEEDEAPAPEADAAAGAKDSGANVKDTPAAAGEQVEEDSYRSSEDSDFSGSGDSDGSESSSDSDSSGDGGSGSDSDGSESDASGDAAVKSGRDSSPSPRKVRTRRKKPIVDYATLNAIMFAGEAENDPDADDAPWSPTSMGSPKPSPAVRRRKPKPEMTVAEDDDDE